MAFSTFINGLTNFLPKAFNDFLGDGLIADAVNGALFGAVTTAIGGGDILKGSLFGAAGNALAGSGDTGIFGEFTNEIGGAITGYGLDKAMGGSGMLGAASGAFLERLNEGNTPTTKGSDKTATELADDQNLFGGGPEAGDTGMLSKADGFMQKYGLQNADGEGTLLGKAAVGAVGQYAASREAEDVREHQLKLVEQSKRTTKELDEEFDQRNLRAFSDRRSPMVVRNG